MRWIIAILIATPLFCAAQKRGAVWVFGDSALVDFSDTSNILTGNSLIKSRGSCASISDSNGQLLFYTGYDTDWMITGAYEKNGEIFNKLHSTMANGDSIIMMGWYHEVVILPYPGTTDKYFVFSILVTGVNLWGIFYSIVDLSANGGLGAVIQKNIQLPNYFNMVDCLTAVKHGNGRDWWLLFRRVYNSPVIPDNEFHSYLVSPAGITNYTVQNIGSTKRTNAGCIAWTTDGSRFSFSNLNGLLELYDFDRCTGTISNPVTVYTESSGPPWPAYWGAAFSPSNQFLYVTRIPLTVTDTSRLYQFDVTAANIAGSADTLWETGFISQLGHLKLAPDGKIYLANNYYGVFPYADSVYNTYNMNLSVIENPDNPGSACNVQPYSFYLGGKRGYFGLPNNPDYDLGPLSGSICDTLTGITDNEHGVSNAALYVTWVQQWKKLFVNAQGLKGNRAGVEVFDMSGSQVYSSALKPDNGQRVSEGYFTEDIYLPQLSSGVYVVRLKTEREVLSKKVVVSAGR